MKKIPYDVQSLIRASNQMNNYNRAVEELVYNSLDAGATSIAVRINIQENTIQVIDNGCGVSIKDYNSIGHKYMTSKFIELSTLKSAPNKYGFRGQALANIINVSKSVKVISRHEHSEETWTKLFEYGTEKLIKKCTTRPSKGTTLEITGFLYNLSIQRQSKDILSDQQSIKNFLEHLSLTHCNISLSLRDDSKNEIIFKIHKNRDIYQTLSTLYNIDKNNLQELQVEKSEYKVTAYFGKSDETGKHFIFLNGKFISNNSKLHKIVNNNMGKQFKPRGIQKSKIKNLNTEDESNWIQKKIPDYFIFIKCPYMDYDLSNSPKHSVLDFNDWDQINKLLEKVIKFFNGDMNLKECNSIHKDQACNKVGYIDTREQVKKIMEKIMGTHTKKPGISHMYNAIKGKQAKRKIKKLSLKPTAGGSNQNENGDPNIQYTNNMVDINNSNHYNRETEKRNKKPVPKKISNGNATKPCLETIIGKKIMQSKQISKNYDSSIPPKKNIDKRNKKKTIKQKTVSTNKDVKHRKFEIQADSVKNRCQERESRTRNLVDQMHKKICNMFLNGNISMDNDISKRQINIRVRKKFDEVIIQSNAFKRPKSKLISEYNACEKIEKKLIQSNYDLLQTILKTQRENNVQIRNVADESNNKAAFMNPPKISRVAGIEDANELINMESKNNFTELITFKSHDYYTHQTYNSVNDNFHLHENIQNDNQYGFHNKPRNFITKQSRDNFVLPNVVIKSKKSKNENVRTGISKQFRSRIKKMFKKTSKLFNLKKQILGYTAESACIIEFTESNSYRLANNKDVIMAGASRNTRMRIKETLPYSGDHAAENNDNICINNKRCIVPNDVKYVYTINDDGPGANWTLRGTYAIEKSNEVISNTDLHNQGNRVGDNSQNNRNFIFVSKSQEHSQNEQIIDPINVCETILHSEEILDKEFELSFNDKQNNLSNKHVKPTIYQGNCDESLYSCFYSKENGQAPEDQNQNTQNIKVQDKTDEVSHHLNPNKKLTNIKVNVNEVINFSPILTSRQKSSSKRQLIQGENSGKIVNESNLDNFNFMNRLRFLPKGMSPIFQNCQTKNICEYNITTDYYEKEMYNNFADDVRNNAEIFEPEIQNAQEITTKAIDKVNAKLTNNSSVLKFDGQSLKDAKVLGQIDEKFIAATMRQGCEVASTDYLVLFDQHAVHERIRLENNLTEYFNENQWKPVKIDSVSLMLSKDDILYLHNYKDKFERLGLQWTVTTANRVSFGAIPEAILGKNPRPVEKVITTIKNLIAEEINIIKIQGGCVSLFPKSIMDLVNSEACRYAIKFGDKLSKSECVELLKTLFVCKTPFQCAHGRPVMAVIMETKRSGVNYKINLDKIMEWKRKL